MTDSLDPVLESFLNRRSHIASAGSGDYHFILIKPSGEQTVLSSGNYANGREALSAFYHLAVSEDFRSKNGDFNEDQLSISFSGQSGV